VRDGQLAPVEFGFMELGGKIVWVGLVVLILSGSLLFWLNPEGYLASSKFQVKMTIVAIIIINGLVLHLKVLPKFRAAIKEGNMPIGEFIGVHPFVLIVGVVSVVSWSSVIILGALRSIPYSYWLALFMYVCVVAVGTVIALLLKFRLFPNAK
jgi:hypothetical protein